MPTNDYEKTAAELCDCISCDVADPCPQVFCNAPEIAKALETARMEGRMDIAKALGSIQLERALRHAIESVGTCPSPGDCPSPEVEDELVTAYANACATVAMLERTIKAHREHFERLSGNLNDGVLSPPQV